MTDCPEENLARRLSQKYDLRLPIEINGLVGRYAQVRELEFPEEADGITFNLKVSNELAIVVLNERKPRKRKRFTLAHELGHILIPWHIGFIVDIVDLEASEPDPQYRQLEIEANRFASELLMPRELVETILRKTRNPQEAHTHLTRQADVSPAAALFQVCKYLLPGYVYAVVDGNEDVRFSGRSAGTFVSAPKRGKLADWKSAHLSSDEKWSHVYGEERYIWWHFPVELQLPPSRDSRPWRYILNEIISKVGIPQSKIEKFKQSLNGVIASANGDSRVRSAEGIYAAIMQRLHNRAETSTDFRKVMGHPKFGSYLVKRISELAIREQSSRTTTCVLNRGLLLL